ncbi:MAG: DUF6489 family protein [Sphingomonas fennica]
MKVTVDIDCTPEEARRFMGLPDLTPVHEAYLSKITRMVEDGVSPDMMESLVRSWGPMGDAGMQMWRQMMDRMTGTTSA